MHLTVVHSLMLESSHSAMTSFCPGFALASGLLPLLLRLLAHEFILLFICAESIFIFSSHFAQIPSRWILPFFQSIIHAAAQV